MDFKFYSSGSHGNLYAIDDGKTSIIVECGVSPKDLQKHIPKLSKFSGCIITHAHSDHSKCVSTIVKSGVEVYSTKGTLSAIKGLKSLMPLCNQIEKQKPFKIGTFKITAYATKHDCVDPVLYIIKSEHTKEKLAFVTDTKSIKYKLDNFDYLVLECYHSRKLLIDIEITRGKIAVERTKNNHINFEYLMKYLKLIKLDKIKKIYLIHLSSHASDEKLFKNEIEKITGVPVIICK